ncbi:MAG: hypothetical protein CMN30_12050 [Sandaracinus sp.]|nr:hypothetical protein [Sandaracinus sp.]
MLTPSGTREARYKVGAIVGGKYRIKRLLGHGGMGSVYKAENTTIGRTVAVKILHPHLADDGVTLARFQREARAAAGIEHPNVVDVLDMGLDEGGAPFIVMEYVRGKSAARLLREEGPFAIARATYVVGQVLDALHAVHQRGIVHRDLKPENVLVTHVEGQADQAKLFDFGVATFMESARDASHELTPTGRAMGTPYYASPEQLGGLSRRDPRIDVYAVGVVLYELLTGSRPFTAESFVELCRQVLEDDPPPMRVFRKDVPPELEAVVGRALDKDIEARFQDARALHQALVPFGAMPLPEDFDDPTDTFTIDLRDLRAREREAEQERRQQATSRAPDVRGLVVAEAFTVARRLGGDQLARMLHRAVDGEPDEALWYPESVLGVLEAGDEAFGTDDRRLLAEVGRAVARRLQAEGAIAAEATPELLFARVADLWGRCFANGQARVRELGLGYGLFEVSGHPRPRLSRAVLMMGLVDEALELVGGRRCEVRLAQSAALGDGIDVYEASWST